MNRAEAQQISSEVPSFRGIHLLHSWGLFLIMCSTKQKNHTFILRIPTKTPEPIVAPLIRSTDSPPLNPPQHHATIPFGFHLQAQTHTFIQQQSFLFESTCTKTRDSRNPKPKPTRGNPTLPQTNPSHTVTNKHHHLRPVIRKSSRYFTTTLRFLLHPEQHQTLTFFPITYIQSE